MVCLDTSILIDYLKGDDKIVKLVISLAKEEKLATTVITEYELLKHHDKIKKEAAQELLSNLKIYSLDREAITESLRVYHSLRDKGKLINENDIFIAGIVLSENELLITRDSDFSKIGEEGRIRVI